jgi:3-phosphoshikimate 1-carboxyvinyltransferase
VVDNLLNSEDVHYMLEALKALGLSVEADKAAKRSVVVGCGGKFPVEKDARDEVQLFLGNAGTAMRPAVNSGCNCCWWKCNVHFFFLVPPWL